MCLKIITHVINTKIIFVKPTSIVPNIKAIKSLIVELSLMSNT